MKKLVFLITVTIFTCGLLYAQSGWFPLNSGTTSGLASVYFTDVNTGYAVGTNGTALKTTNAGVNWFSLTMPATDLLRFLFFTDVNTGYIASQVNGTSTGNIFKTTNGGNTWNAQVLPVYSAFYSLYFINSNTGYAAGYETILKTTNAGATWNESQTFTGLGFIFSIYFVDANTGYTATYNSKKILKTTNGGTDWQEIFTNNEGFYGIHFIDANTGVAVGGSQVTLGSAFIIRTTNGGENWTNCTFNNSNIFKLWSVRFVSPSIGYSAGGSGSILKTTNGGINWYFQTSNADTSLNGNYFLNANTGYIVGNAGRILKTTDGGGTLLAVNSDGNQIPARYSLSQNYPNPFNPVTKINFDVPVCHSGEGRNPVVKLVIYDMLGRKVRTLVNKVMNAGSYSVDFNGNELSSGVYFYRLQSAEFTDIKRMTLIK